MNEDKRNRQRVAMAKLNYPPGTRIELIEMREEFMPVPPGTRGTVNHVDDAGGLHMTWDNGRTLAVIPGVDQFRKLTEQEIAAENSPRLPDAVIEKITTKDLRRMRDREGLVMEGCGGDPREWLCGVNDMLTEVGILQEGSRFRKICTFQHDGRTCILFPFTEDVKLDIGKLAVWRLQTHSQFGSTWLSDFVENRLDGFSQEKTEQEKPDCPLIGQDGNIFNLMGIAARTLREHGLDDQATEMLQRVHQSGSYDAALCVIGEYVNITSADEMDTVVDEMKLE